MERIEERAGADDATGFVPCFWCERLHEGELALSVCSPCGARLRTLGLLGMSGSYPLNDAAIDEALERTSPGNYALGFMDGDSFVVFYVGRSPSDVRQRLHEWVTMPSRFERWAPPARAAWGSSRRGSFPVDTPTLANVANGDTAYTRFAFSYAASADAAYERECRNYQDFGGNRQLDNEAPPTAAGI